MGKNHRQMLQVHSKGFRQDFRGELDIFFVATLSQNGFRKLRDPPREAGVR